MDAEPELSAALHFILLNICCCRPCLHFGGDTHKIPLKLFAVNRERLCSKLKEEKCLQGAVVVLQGGEQKQQYCTDTDEVFRQVYVFK